LEGGETARRRVPESELVYPTQEESDRVKQVVDRLVEARLLVKGQLETGEPYVEAAHDFLVRGWGKLQNWIDEEKAKETLELKQRLTAQANDWDRNNRPDGLFLSDGDRLNHLEKLLKQNDIWLNQRESQFVETSLSFRDAQKRRARELQVRAELQQKAARVLSQISINPLEAITIAIQATGQNLEELPNELLAPVQRSLHIAMNKARIPKRSFVGQHTSRINSIAFHPNSQYIVSGSDDKTIRLWNWEQDLVTPPFLGHEGEVTSVVFGHNGQYIIVYSIAFSPKGEMIVSGSYDRTIRLWNLKGEQIGTFGNEDVRSVAFSPNGQIIASTGMEFTVRLWDLKGSAIGCLPYGSNEQPAGFNKVAYSPDGQKIACLGSKFSIRLWDWNKNLIQDSAEEANNVIQSIDFNSDGRMIVTSDVGGSVCLWDLDDNFARQEFRLPSSVHAACFSPVEQTLVSGTADGKVFLWDTHGNIVSAFQGHDKGISAVAFSPDGRIIASGGWNGTIQLWRGSWKAWLKVCCDRVRHHPVFKDPQTDSAKAVCEICQKYVWSKEDTSV
jgi:WD40 repeat protein